MAVGIGHRLSVGARVHAEACARWKPLLPAALAATLRLETSMRAVLICLLIAAASLASAAEEVKELFDFEDGADGFEAGAGAAAPSVVAEHATRGTKALRVPCAPTGYIGRFTKSDWSGYDELEIDAFVDGPGDVAGTLLIGDEAWEQHGRTYWNRHNSGFTLHPGANVITIATGGLYRGESGSRGNDLKTTIDPSRIRRFDLGFTFRGGGTGAVYLDRFHLMRDRAPAGVLAFSFGPDGHALMPGFAPIGWNTVHGKGGVSAGLRRACYNPNRARDDGFPTRLFGNLVELEDGNTIVVDVPAGDYGAWLVLDDPGYWDWECARFTKRVITANGTVVSTEEPEFGRNQHLFRFERIEPTSDTDLYTTYIEPMYPQRRFTVAALDGHIEIGVEAGSRSAQKVAALVLWPLARRAEAERWLDQVIARNRAEFVRRAVNLEAQKPLPAPPSDAGPYWLRRPSLEQDLRFGDEPGGSGQAAREGARGERISFTFALRPQTDLGEVAALTAELSGPAGTIPSRAIDCRYVHHALRRGPDDIAYTIGPDTVRPVAGAGLHLPRNQTRQFWITVAIPSDAKPGIYSGAATLRLANGTAIAEPFSVEVLDVALDQPDFLDAYLGFGSPVAVADEAHAKSARDELFAVLRDGGMNSLTDGPGIPFTGFGPDGAPQLDFAEIDEFFAAARAAGLPLKDVLTYGGLAWPQGVSSSYELDGSTEETAKRFGKPYGDVIAAVFAAIDAHAREHGWPIIRYCRCDEPRVLDQAQRVLADMRLFRERAPMARIGGFYSVDWQKPDALDQAIRDIFGTLTWSGLNAHGAADLEQARTQDREVYIYNQGTSRYSFGAYQWSEWRKGVRGRAQWHLAAISGWQFFDLDGREPDAGYVRWSSSGILPTLAYHRTREGVDDFRWAETLWNRAEHAGAAGAEAKAWLQGVADAIPAGATAPSKDWMGDDAFRAGCAKRMLALPR
jgi:hypothetical protein